MRIFFIGKKSNRNLTESIEDYVQRISKYQTLEYHYLGIRESSTKMPESVVKKKECDKLLDKINTDDVLVLLDEGGKQFTSNDFAKWVLKEEHNLRRITFVIGGSYGFDDRLLKRAFTKISLSPMTYPHHLARLIFCEQLYRAFTIINGEPYHHA